MRLSILPRAAESRLSRGKCEKFRLQIPNRQSKIENPFGVVAQLVEHHNGIVGVRGSNPLGSTTLAVNSLRNNGLRVTTRSNNKAKAIHRCSRLFVAVPIGGECLFSGASSNQPKATRSPCSD